MPIHSLVAAKKVCILRNWDVTNLEVNKILYIAQMVFLGRSNGKTPLVSEHFQAWDYGPVLPTVYHRLKAFGDGHVENVLKIFPTISKTNESNILEEAVEITSDKQSGQLIAITHWENGAWARNYRPGVKGVVIPNSDIYKEYISRVRRS